MRREADPRWPDWPVLMSPEMAARYLSLDVAGFRDVAQTGGLAPAELGLELERWRKADLDCFVAQLALRRARPRPPVERPPPEIRNPVEKALAEPPSVSLSSSRQAMSIKDAAAAIGLGRSTLYKLISQGRLQKIKVGGRTLVRSEDLISLIGGCRQV